MKTVLVTGASRGIGAEIARAFGEAGYRVALNYNSNEACAGAVRDDIIREGGCAEIFRADVSDALQVEKMMDEIKTKLGAVDILINNAGVAPVQGLFTDLSAEEIQKTFNINVFGAMNCSKAVIPYMVNKKKGQIINISSIWGICGGSCEVVYSASKAALIGFTKSLARELAPSGIRVNCVAPGFVDTQMNSHLSPEEKDAFCEEIPLGRIAAPAEIAETVLFLASGSASYITGQVLTVDGGFI